MRIGLGPSSGEIHKLLAEAGERAAAVARLVERRFLRVAVGADAGRGEGARARGRPRSSPSLLSLTNSMFVTPYDRDDIVTLAFAVDDVADAAENAAELLGLYGVETADEAVVRAVRAARPGDGGARDAARRAARPSTARRTAIRAIKEIEDEADDVARAARASLFKDDRIDPVIVIRWKDIYEALEDAVDACETAAHRVGNILVKNA